MGGKGCDPDGSHAIKAWTARPTTDSVSSSLWVDGPWPIRKRKPVLSKSKTLSVR